MLPNVFKITIKLVSEKHRPGVDMAWRERVDSDVLRAQLTSHASSHLEYCRLACVIRYPCVILQHESR
jgi:hypothetical protein